jgi:type IV secretory pathway TrbL component
MKILDPNGLVDNIYKYVQTNIEIAKVEVQEKIEDTIKKVAIITILVLSVAMLLIFLLLTLALFLNQILVSGYLGFLIVSILLAVIMAITFFMAKQFLNSDKEMEKESLSEKEPLP